MRLTWPRGRGSCEPHNLVNSGVVLPSSTSAHTRRLARVTPAMYSENSSATSGCLCRNIPCSTNGPIRVGFKGSNIHFSATQFVMYPTIDPTSGKVHGFGNIIQNNICTKPSRNPTPKPLSMRNLSSFRPTLWKKFERVVLSVAKPETTKERMSTTSGALLITALHDLARKKRLMKGGLKPPRTLERTSGSSSFAICLGSSLLKISATFNNLEMVTSTIVWAMRSLLDGTMPCQPNQPKGCSGYRSSGMPVQLTG
mmetsp:Transcript_62205/g.103369  ORF Transcript_62205/g.103369 Transcript_62205/m.103369 type:complete len:255 (+) Transcript_62205:406-1170(+)